MLRPVVGNEANCVVRVGFFGGEIFVTGDNIFVSSEGGIGSKLSGTVINIHGWMFARCVPREVDEVGVILVHVYSIYDYYARCPPICRWRWRPVAPSSKFVPRRMAFLP